MLKNSKSAVMLRLLHVVFVLCTGPLISYVQGDDCDSGAELPGCTITDSFCDGSNRCYDCKYGHVLVNDKFGQQECVECDTGVKKCTMCSYDTKRCVMCENGYRLVTNRKGIQKCKKCYSSVGDNCSMCSQDRRKCVRCFDGNFKLGSDGKCYRLDTPVFDEIIQKVEHCQMSSGGLCELCHDGYILVTEENGMTQECKKCNTGVSNCNECTPDGKTCTWCSRGYTIHEGSCRKSTS